MRGLGDVGLAHPDAEIDRAAGHGGEAVLVGSEVAGDQREQVGGLGEGVVPLGPVGAVVALTPGGAIAVGEEDREARFVGAHAYGVDREDVGAVGVKGDAAETLALALGAEDPARGVKPHQFAVGGGGEGDFTLDNRAVAGKVDDERRAVHDDGGFDAIDLEPVSRDLAAFEAERAGVVAVARDGQARPHGRGVGIEGEVERDFGDEPVGRAVVAAAGFGVGRGGGGGGADVHQLTLVSAAGGGNAPWPRRWSICQRTGQWCVV